jgi:hypothetical protein
LRAVSVSATSSANISLSELGIAEEYLMFESVTVLLGYAALNGSS